MRGELRQSYPLVVVYGAKTNDDLDRLIQHLQFAGFSKEKEIAFPHKQAWFGRKLRENWEGPAL